ncbi:hypothetical protein C492_06921 [Natronococcus jeotgali DSM 18795]|uniref:Uncharacterized protein n=1 Tax=Natronococcus jeotgali DSM 18795 TaxID=1227498 RepID=L9XQM2_9EURY|nr:hypothetical protein C492_06921 [Natronococcus jeotgali DSM 18795]
MAFSTIPSKFSRLIEWSDPEFVLFAISRSEKAVSLDLLGLREEYICSSLGSLFAALSEFSKRGG